MTDHVVSIVLHLPRSIVGVRFIDCLLKERDARLNDFALYNSLLYQRNQRCYVTCLCPVSVGLISAGNAMILPQPATSLLQHFADRSRPFILGPCMNPS